MNPGASRILIDLGERQNGGYVTLKEIAERQMLSEKYLESIVRELVRARLVEGLRGKGGGYRLSRPAEEINVRDVLHRLEGTLVPVACLEEGSKPCIRRDDCRTLPPLEGAGQGRQRVSGKLYRTGSCEAGHRRILLSIQPHPKGCGCHSVFLSVR